MNQYRNIIHVLFFGNLYIKKFTGLSELITTNEQS
jgi:hypothetical protein